MAIRELFRPKSCDETILIGDETILRFLRKRPETAVGYWFLNETASNANPEIGDDQMRTVSFILAFAFLLAGPSIAGSSDRGLPGIGTFSYNGSPVVTSGHSTMVVAAN